MSNVGGLVQTKHVMMASEPRSGKPYCVGHSGHVEPNLPSLTVGVTVGASRDAHGLWQHAKEAEYSSKRVTQHRHHPRD